jgi:hypothetical protein
MHDQIEQTIGPHVMVQINGLSRCQHRIFEQVRLSKRDVISMEELHLTSLRQHDFAEFHQGISRILDQHGLTVTDISLSAQLHRVGLDALSRLERLSHSSAAIALQLTLLVQARRCGDIPSDAHFALAEMQFGLAA